MTIKTSIEINPNLRVEGDQTIADLDEDVHGPVPRQFEEVAVYERASGLFGRAWVSAVDEEDRTILLTVDWASLTIPGGNVAVLQMGWPVASNMSLGHVVQE